MFRPRISLSVVVTAALGILVTGPGLLPAPGATTLAPDAGSTVDAAPVTVPALQRWVAGGRDFVLPAGALTVEVAGSYASRLAEDARTFADDLRASTGREVVVRTVPEQAASSAPQAGEANAPDVVRLTLDPDWTEHGDEASRITVDGDVTIAGPTSDGVFSGTRSVLQMLHQSDRIAGGVAEDWPAYPERSFMIDNGRKYFTPAWAKRQIRQLSYLKYNQFHWHIADNAGFRIESKTHPEVVSPEHWTQEQVRELVEYAAKYHVEVIPEIDMPGHMQYALRHHPELQVVDADGNRNSRNLDPTDPAARQFAKELLDELVPLFPGRYVHTGGDEYTSDWDRYPVLTEWAQDVYGPEANSHDAVLDFTNYLNGIIRSHGKTMRMWNDGAQGGAVVEADRDIVLEYWSSQHGGVLAQEFLDRGYRLVNANRDFLYDVPGATPTWNNLDPRKVFEGWDMSQWHDWIGPNTTDPHADGVLGGQLHVWNDDPSAATEEQIAGRVQMPLRAMAQHLWGSTVDETTWDAYVARVFAVGDEPRWDRLDGPSQNLAEGALVWSSARERPDCHESALVDGHDDTRWCGPKAEPQSVVVDLGESVDVGTVVLDWEAAFASGYTLEVSDDLTSWTPIATTSTGDGGLDRLEVSGQGRFLRLSMTERGTRWGYSLYEIEVYAPGALIPRDFAAAFAPPVVLASAESPSDSTLTLSNSSGQAAVVRWSADPPSGVDVTPSSGWMRVPAGGSADATVRVTSSEAGSATVPVTIEARSDGAMVPLAESHLRVSVPYERLADAYTNVSVTSDADVNPPTLGTGLDGAGSSYSAEALAALGITPGSPLTSGGVTVHWPDVPVAQPNNVVANGQSVRIDASGDAIGVMAVGTYGTVTADWVVHYADGTWETVRLSTPDWSSSPPAGSTVLASMSYRNNSATGSTQRLTQIFFHRIPIDPAKTVVALTLPTVSESAVRGAPALHVFDVALA